MGGGSSYRGFHVRVQPACPRPAEKLEHVLWLEVPQELGDDEVTRLLSAAADPSRPWRLCRIAVDSDQEAQHIRAGATRLGFRLMGMVQPPADGPGNLTPRERQVLEGLYSGMTEKQVSDRLGVSPHTVHRFVKQLYMKFAVHSRAQLLAQALKQAGLISPLDASR